MVGEAGSGLRAAAGSWALPLSPAQHPLSQRGARMAGGPPGQPGARVSGGDGEHKESQKITPTVKPSSVGRIQLLLSAFHR